LRARVLHGHARKGSRAQVLGGVTPSHKWKLSTSLTHSNSITPMSHLTARNLWCIVESQTTPFVVTVSLDVSIGQFKKLVREMKGKWTFREVDAADLVLWKVRATFSYGV
jgi:hypothetical protein